MKGEPKGNSNMVDSDYWRLLGDESKEELEVDGRRSLKYWGISGTASTGVLWDRTFQTFSSIEVDLSMKSELNLYGECCKAINVSRVRGNTIILTRPSFKVRRLHNNFLTQFRGRDMHRTITGYEPNQSNVLSHPWVHSYHSLLINPPFVSFHFHTSESSRLSETHWRLKSLGLWT